MPQTHTSHLPTLLKRYEALTRNIAHLEGERAAVQDQILAAGRGAAPRKARPAQTTASAVEVVRDAVRVLREAGEPLPRREVAARLGLKPWVAGYRLDKAVEMKFAEKLDGGRYRVTNVVPAF
jgi:methylphosphotriester-DNA--protein-cysteine methyltransferase